MHAPGKGLLRLLLDLGVDRQDERAARNRLDLRAQDLDVATGRIPLDRLEAIGAPKLLLIGRFNARPADEVIGQVALLTEVRELIAADRPEVAEDVGEEGAH